MSAPRWIIFLAFTACLMITVPTQAQGFNGRWQTSVAPVVGRPAFTVIIFENLSKVSGSLIRVFPDGSQREMPIVQPFFNGGTLQFQTFDREEAFDWRLTLTRDKRKAVLHGVEKQPASGQRSGEMVIELPVRRVANL